MKYFIELEDEPVNGLYKAKGFNTLVFDKNGLNKLVSADDSLTHSRRMGYALGLKEGRQSLTESSLGSYNKGLNDAWELAKKVVLNENESGMSLGDLHKAFGDFSYYCILKFSSGVEAWSAYNKFLKSKAVEEELKVKTQIESITETATEVTFTLTDGTKRVISIEDITGGSEMKIVTESDYYNTYQGDNNNDNHYTESNHQTDQ